MSNAWLVFVLLVFWQATAFWLFSFNNEEKKCIQQLDLNETRLKDVFFGPTSPENDMEFNDFLQCVWLRLGFQDEKGVINYEKLKESFDIAGKIGEDYSHFLERMGELRFGAVGACEKNPPSPGKTHGQTAARLTNCIIKKYLEASHNKLT